MSKTVVETFYGKYSKYEVVRDPGILSTSFYIYKDGKYDSSYKSLSAAVANAKERSER